MTALRIDDKSAEADRRRDVCRQPILV